MEELRISKQSLGVVPTTFVPDQPPPSSFMGYSGGSMLILAIFMLILGGAIGVGVAFFIYKRQHLSGLAYQVFE
ncbi:hypothetical protein AB6A40_004283 [Gnathostoma spinigerum]|uniref:Uncharacterized protein n=1 Tax=Gnathostoma spinigerum TaxID=75299 RepID=A0ABD6EHE6_9BILA